jgi:hypothetical protein
MNWKKYNWSIIVIGILLTFAGASGSYYFWQQNMVTKPLALAIQEIQGIEIVTLDTQDKLQNVLGIDVTLNNINNLQTTYELINHTIKTNIGSKKYKLTLHDHRTPPLEELYYSIHHQIYEGISTGQFSRMYEIIREKATAVDTRAQVYVDSNYVYIQLSTATGNLYQVIPRHPDNKEVK